MTTMTMTNKKTVAVIGCGPGGMFVCHALERKRQELLEQLEQNPTTRADVESQLENLPYIMCFEQASAPGGVWRSSSNKNKSTSDTTQQQQQCYKTDTNMYEALWCNGAKELMEFADYPFTHHFGREQALPTYLPRQAVLEYLTRRCTRQCPDFFDKYATFDTKVDQVTYDPITTQFTVYTTTTHTTHDNNDDNDKPTTTSNVHTFDKVLWSAGQNGIGKIPPQLQSQFDQAHLEFISNNSSTTTTTSLPLFLHACQLEQDVAERIRDQHLLLIGGSYSAEDLAFMGIKWGARHITVLARRHGIDVPICWTTNWPFDKVTVLTGYQVSNVQVVVDANDTDPQQVASYTITLAKYSHETSVTIVDETNGLAAHAIAKDKYKTPPVLTNIHAVVCCTGYTEHWEMMDKSCFNMTDEEYECYQNRSDKLELAPNWTMPHNPLSAFIYKYHSGNDIVDADLHHDKDEDEDAPFDEKKTMEEMARDNQQQQQQHIPPQKKLVPGRFANPYTYREVLLVNNPNLMMLAAQNFDTPLLALDVQACLALRYITGEVAIPSRDEMMAQNYQQALEEMSLPMTRYWMDDNYYHAVQKWLSETTRKVYFINRHGSLSCRFEYPNEWKQVFRQNGEFQLRLLARLMQEADYPLRLGTYHELNDHGQAFLDMDWIHSRLVETCSKTGTTFRDVPPEQCAKIQSIITGAVSVPLKGKWLEMDDLMQNVSQLVE